MKNMQISSLLWLLMLPLFVFIALYAGIDQLGLFSTLTQGAVGDTVFQLALLLAAGLLLSLPFYYSLIIVHNCVHNTVTRSKRLNGWIGEVISFVNLSRFEDYRAIHTLHHAKTNQHGKDPHYLRPGESRLHFAFTQYYQLILFTYTDYYRQVMFTEFWKEVDPNSSVIRRRDRLGKILIVSGRKPHTLLYMFLPWNNVFTLLMVVFGATYLIGGASALAYPVMLWLLPSFIGYMLIADFNYRGHIGLPEKGNKHPYAGEDSRNLNYGWGRLLDWLTDGFYRHQDHHRWPSSKGSRPPVRAFFVRTLSEDS